jgi:plastocyanin
MRLAQFFRYTGVILSALAIMGAAAACGGDSSAEKSPTVSVKGSGQAEGGGGAATSAPSGSSSTAVKITLKDNVFDPKDLKVPAGKTITFTLTNDGTAIHNMHILSKSTEGKEFQSELTITAGRTSKFEAKFNKKGLIKFQCDFHVPDMVGTITVE